MRPILTYGCLDREAVTLADVVDKDIRIIACENDRNVFEEEAVLVDGIVGESFRGKVGLLAVRSGSNGILRVIKDDRDRSDMISWMMFVDFASRKKACSSCAGKGALEGKGFCRDCRGIGALSADTTILHPWIERARLATPADRFRMIFVCSCLGDRCAACGVAHSAEGIDDRLCARCARTHMQPRETVLALTGVNFTLMLLDDMPGCGVPDTGLIRTAKDSKSVETFGESMTIGLLIAEMHHEPVEVTDAAHRHLRLSQSAP